MRDILRVRPAAGWLAAVVAALVLVSGPRAGAANTPSPTQVVERFHASLLDVMKNAKTLGYQGRYRELTPAIDEAFHLPAMTRIVAGASTWRGLTDEQKRAFVEAFSEMTTATYAFRFDGWSGESFQTLAAVPIQPKATLVKTRLVKSDGEAIELNYLLQDFASGWRVIDIYLKGTISELATKRSEYASVLRRDGLDGLLALIHNKVASLAAGHAKD